MFISFSYYMRISGYGMSNLYIASLVFLTKGSRLIESLPMGTDSSGPDDEKKRT